MKKGIRNTIIAIAVIIVMIILAFIASDYIIFGKNEKMNLVINNNNITANMKNDVVIENGIIYLSKTDMQNFFDNYISEIEGKVVTTYDKKIAEIGFEENEMEINGSTITTEAHARRGDDGETYIPISEMKDVYGIEIQTNEETKVVTIDSLDREQKKCGVTKNVPLKSSKGIIAKTLARVKKGESVVKIEETDDGWSKVRTEGGKIGYIKTNKLGNEIEVRGNMEEEKQVEGKINMVWDYYSESEKAPDRSGTTIDGINVVSPAFFYISNDGKLQEKVGEMGERYIEWAHNNGYKVWPMVSNAGDGMIEVTSTIMNDYEKRKELIEQIVNVCVKYKLDGINIDFENMKQEDKDLYSRFIIELTPRIKDIGDVISVDTTAPDGGETWSMCFDRHVIGNVANYIVFMAYDEYGVASTTPGTTAGYDWAKLSLEKYLKTEEIDPSKIILAVPFYTRIWTEQPDGTAKSATVNMKDINRVIPEGVQPEWKDDLKQNYVEYKDGNATKKMWIEDEKSLKEKLSLISENNLAGVAEWAKDMEDESIWKTIKQEINE